MNIITTKIIKITDEGKKLAVQLGLTGKNYNSICSDICREAKKYAKLENGMNERIISDELSSEDFDKWETQVINKLDKLEGILSRLSDKLPDGIISFKSRYGTPNYIISIYCRNTCYVGVPGSEWTTY